MPQDTDLVNVTLHMESGDLNADELDQMTYDLQVWLRDLNVESVDLVRDEQALRPGTKAVDPVTLGALVVVVVQTALPKVLELLQAWSLRKQGRVVKVKIQSGNKSVEAEFPDTDMEPDKVKSYIEALMGPVEEKSKHH